MALDEQQTSYLQELNRRVAGDQTAQVSMYEVGETLGLARSDAGSMAETLMVEGYLELKTLSGGVGITTEGLLALGLKPEGAQTPVVSLGKGERLEPSGKEVVAELLSAVRASFPLANGEFPVVEQLLIDLKTIEVQMLAERPRLGIIKSGLLGLAAGLADGGRHELAEKLRQTVAA